MKAWNPNQKPTRDPSLVFVQAGLEGYVGVKKDYFACKKWGYQRLYTFLHMLLLMGISLNLESWHLEEFLLLLGQPS